MAKEEELVTENTGLQVSSKAYRAASKGGKEGELSENWCLKVVLGEAARSVELARRSLLQPVAEVSALLSTTLLSSV
jgi:hypothetical protein